jgi:hypothetical protein
MATQITGGGSTASFTNMPQAKDDLYGWTEEQLLATGLYYNHLIVMSPGGPATYGIAETNDVAVITSSSTAELTTTKLALSTGGDLPAASIPFHRS